MNEFGCDFTIELNWFEGQKSKIDLDVKTLNIVKTKRQHNISI